MKMDYKKLFLLGFGFMGISVIWALYNADVPVILQSQFGMSNFATGWIMNIDNIFAVTLIPIIAAYSDKVSTKIGRRMPFIVTGMPLMAVFFALIPWIPILFGTSTTALVIFMITVIVMNISAAVSRGPVIALMPDIVPPEQRSPANGVINFMGGLGSLLVYFGIGRISSQNRPLGFGIAAAITLVAVFVVYKAINEPRDAIYYKSQAEETPWWKNIGSMLNKEHKDLWFMLLAIFLWFIAYNAVETFYVVYMSLESGMDPTVAENLAKLNLGVMSLVFMVFALPSGWLANKFGRKRVMSFGLVFMLLAVTGIMFTRNALWLNLLFALAGIGWAMININSLPTVVDMGSLAEVGTFTGLYYFSSQAASIVSPPLIGFISDLAKSKYVMFPYALIFFLLSLMCLENVKKGDIVTKNSA